MSARDKFEKPPLQSIAIFGAGGRMGQQVADYLSYAAPHVALRRLASSERSAEELRKRSPEQDIRAANYFDAASLDAVLGDVDGVFVVTPPGLDERPAMENLVAALKKAGRVRQVIRLLGYAPEFSPAKFPWDKLKTGGEHFIAKEILEQSGLPVTYVNLGASLFDNFYFTRGGLLRSRTLIWPERSLPLMDVRDLGEVIARLFLDSDARYIGSFLTLNNGYDYVTTTQMAKTMSDAFRVPIAAETSREAFLAEYGPIFQQRFGNADMAEALLDYFEWEHEHWLWQINDTAERILTRRPNTLFNWLREHRAEFVPDIAISASDDLLGKVKRA